MSLTAQQRVSKAKVWIMSSKEWKCIAPVVMMGKTKFVGDDDSIQTAATNGRDETYNNTFVSKLTDEQVRFLVLHEGLHKYFRHLHTWKELQKEDPTLANISMDVVINNQYLIGKAGLAFIEDGVDMPEYKDKMVWSTRKVFEDLKRKGYGSGSGSGSGSGGGHDYHDWDGASAMTAEEGDELEKRIDQVMRQGAIAGLGTSDLARQAQAALVPKVDWQSLISQFIKSHTRGQDKRTWRRPRGAYLAVDPDMYQPSPYSVTIPRILICGDTSGSIGGEELSKFLGFMQQLCDEVKPNGADIAWWDTKVCGVDKFEKGAINLVRGVRPKGGGGTDPSCLPEYISKASTEGTEYCCAVVITDGEFYGERVGQWDIPVIWLVVGGYKVSIPVGQVVHAGEEL
jgi:predicted metal-dependent peptidase